MRRRRASTTTASALAVRELPARGRGVVATRAIPRGAVLLEVAPMAHVLKARPRSTSWCVACLRPLASRAPQYCSSACEAAHVARGGALLERVNLSGLRALHVEQGRKFPLLVASLLASLLAEAKSTGRLPTPWAPLELCFAELPMEVPIETEWRELLGRFADAGLADLAALEHVFLPLAAYRRLLGAAQLNAFELTLAHPAEDGGATRVSALLPGTASMFNHSCSPNVLVSCGETAHVAFVAGDDVEANTELCISYVGLDASGEERRRLLAQQYGFECRCVRCAERGGG